LKSKNKVNRIFVVTVILVFSFIIWILLNYSNKDISMGDIYKKENVELLWKAYDMQLENIKNNMNEISNPQKEFFNKNSDEVYWKSLNKNFNEDEDYVKILNQLSTDIGICYAEFNLDFSYSDDVNPILKYRNVEKISQEEVEILRSKMNYNNNQSFTCFKRLEKYNNMFISSNVQTRENFLNRINSIITMHRSDLFDYEQGKNIYKKKTITFNELLTYRYIEVTLIDNLSVWLRSEYYRLN